MRGTLPIEYTLARVGAERLWEMLNSGGYVNALGAVTGNQAVQMVEAGLSAIYVSGWQVAADANNAGQMYPDQSLYPADSVPNLARRLNNALTRADQIHHSEGKNGINWFVPLIADAEAGFGGTLNAFELMKAMIEAGAACVHFEDQLSSAKKCGHLGGKVLVPTQEAIQKLVAARLAADVLGVPTLVLARTDADSAHLLTSDIDPYDRIFLNGERTPEGFYGIHGGLDSAIARGLAYAPYCDLIWCETSQPNLKEAELFADAIHKKFPGKMLAYNCSPSFNWKKKLDDATIARFQPALAEMGYKFQFITLAGFHALNLSMFELARAYKDSGHDRLLAPAGEGIRARVQPRLLRGQAPAFCRHRIFRRGYAGDRQRQVFGHGTGAFDGSRTVQRNEGAGADDRDGTGSVLPADPGRVSSDLRARSRACAEQLTRPTTKVSPQQENAR